MPLQNQYKQMTITKQLYAHVIKEKISGNNVDTSVLEAEMNKLHIKKISLEMVDVLEKHLPSILESIILEIKN